MQPDDIQTFWIHFDSAYIIFKKMCYLIYYTDHVLLLLSVEYDFI